MTSESPPARHPPILAVDPGREKCGVAVVSSDGQILDRRITPCEELGSVLRALGEEYGSATVVVGNQTGHSRALESIQGAQLALSVHGVEERDSTLQARQLYFECNPPRGWRRLLPLSLQTPPVPYDDYAAVVLARRFLGHASTPTTE